MESEDVLAPTPQQEKVKSKVKKRKISEEGDGGNKKKKKGGDDEKNEKDSEIGQVKEKKTRNKKSKSSPVSKDSQESTPSPPKEVSVSSRKPGEKRRGHRQFMNEDGFMVTEKVYENESFSEESDSELMQKDEKDIPEEKVKQIQAKKVTAEFQKNIKQHSKKPKTQAP